MHDVNVDALRLADSGRRALIDVKLERRAGSDAAFRWFDGQRHADQAARRGDTPVIVFLTDGQANVTRDGVGERARAEKDAFANAQRLAKYGFASVVIDTSPCPQIRAQRLAQELGARYVPLPSADPARVAQAVQAATR